HRARWPARFHPRFFARLFHPDSPARRRCRVQKQFGVELLTPNWRWPAKQKAAAGRFSSLRILAALYGNASVTRKVTKRATESTTRYARPPKTNFTTLKNQPCQ